MLYFGLLASVRHGAFIKALARLSLSILISKRGLILVIIKDTLAGLRKLNRGLDNIFKVQWQHFRPSVARVKKLWQKQKVRNYMENKTMECQFELIWLWSHIERSYWASVANWALVYWFISCCLSSISKNVFYLIFCCQSLLGNWHLRLCVRACGRAGVCVIKFPSIFFSPFTCICDDEHSFENISEWNSKVSVHVGVTPLCIYSCLASWRVEQMGCLMEN